jgi:tetratricopeptide (TPR) repeat protein
VRGLSITSRLVLVAALGLVAACGRGGEVSRAELLEQSELLFRVGRYEEAVVFYEEVQRQHAGWEYAGYALTMAGVCHQRMGNDAEAIRTWERMVEAYPELPGFSETTWYYLGQAYTETGREDDAREALTRCVALCEWGVPPGAFPRRDAEELLALLH